MQFPLYPKKNDVYLWYWDSSKTSSRIVGINYLKREDQILERERERFKSLYILNLISYYTKNESFRIQCFLTSSHNSY